jgi:N-acetylmuramoyl-L-alanine amidase
MHSSPNFDDRSSAIDMLILHYTGMKTGAEALARLCDPAAKVSAHYMVEEDGRVFALVPEEKRAWHAGVSNWRSKEGLNDCSIGIEIVNPGHEFGYRPFPPAQMQAVIKLCQDILGRHNIPARNVIAHSDIAPARKEDPGELFDWALLAKNGIGLWPEITASSTILHEIGKRNEAIMEFQHGLAHYGYGITTDGTFGTKTEFVVKAFQRHFTPHNLNGCWTEECAAALQALLGKIR